ncbi:hypothetical protein LG201_02360 [Methylobacillus gramineus]|uniref:hypothetical protein n=1 Tax=Methylobacillus gramineus TaxID=755169 RepID=UPI001CFFFE7C|nr:hypothetical protein [Methylobacillus gramineus]MCB5184040.1 hypothetical protein [Methylobacillus gramineus]
MLIGIKVSVLELPWEHPFHFMLIARGTIIHSGRIIRLERQAKTGWILYLNGLGEPVAIGRAFRHALRHTLGF